MVSCCAHVMICSKSLTILQSLRPAHGAAQAMAASQDASRQLSMPRCGVAASWPQVQDAPAWGSNASLIQTQAAGFTDAAPPAPWSEASHAMRAFARMETHIAPASLPDGGLATVASAEFSAVVSYGSGALKRSRSRMSGQLPDSEVFGDIMGVLQCAISVCLWLFRSCVSNLRGEVSCNFGHHKVHV